MLATPIGIRDVVLGHQLWMTARVASTSAVYLLVIAAFGGVNSPLGILALPAAVLIGAAFTAPFAAYAATLESDAAFVGVNRFIVVPMFLFSGTFFPVSAPASAPRMARLCDAAVARGRALSHVHARGREWVACARPRGLPPAVRGDRFGVGPAQLFGEAAEMTAAAIAGGRAHWLFERNLMVYRRSWMVIFSGVFEPLFDFSMGIGLGHFVGNVPGPGGRLIDYASFVAPALLASAAMNGAIYDGTNVFWKLKYMKTYDAMLSSRSGRPTSRSARQRGPCSGASSTRSLSWPWRERSA